MIQGKGNTGLVHELVKLVVGVTVFQLVVLHKKGTLTDKFFAIPRN